jgi:hypothetical protein
MWRLFGSICATCGAKTRDVVAAPAETSLGQKASLCGRCAGRIRDGWTALMLASESGRTDVVRALLDRGANVNTKQKDKVYRGGYGGGDTALILASKNGHLEVVQALLDKGADRDTMNNVDMTALEFASEKGYLEVVRALLRKDCKLNKALWLASEKGHFDVVKALLDKGADVSGSMGEHALIGASEEGYLDVVQSLLDGGANVKCENSRGETAQELAFKNGHLDVVKLLLRHGAAPVPEPHEPHTIDFAVQECPSCRHRNETPFVLKITGKWGLPSSSTQGKSRCYIYNEKYRCKHCKEIFTAGIYSATPIVKDQILKVTVSLARRDGSIFWHGKASRERDGVWHLHSVTSEERGWN